MHISLIVLFCTAVVSCGRRVQNSFDLAQGRVTGSRFSNTFSSRPLANSRYPQSLGTTSALSLAHRYRSSLVRMHSGGNEPNEAKTRGVDQPIPGAEKFEASPSVESEWSGGAKTFLAVVFANVASRMALASRRRTTVVQSSDKNVEVKPWFSIDIVLLICVCLWYLGNYQCNITTKLAHKAAGGASGFPFIIATLQLGVGVLYALFLWAAPDARKLPSMTIKEYFMTLPVGATAAYAHAATHLALSAGSVSFSQIIKTAEPFFVALIGTVLYGARASIAKWLCLIPVVGGVCLATLGELHFSMTALLGASCSNLFNAFKANENKRLMTTPGISDSLRSVNNQFAIVIINAFLFCLPVALFREGHKLGAFIEVCKINPAVPNNIIVSGLWFYMYSELSTIVIKRTSAVTQSVLNTAKRVIIIIGIAILMREGLSPIKLIGCCIGISGVFLYSLIDRLIPTRESS